MTPAAGAGGLRVTNLVPADDLTPARENWLLDGLVAALPGMRLRSLFALRRDMFREADLITVVEDTDRGVAVGALSSRQVTLRHGEHCQHVTTQFVGDDYRTGPAFRRSWSVHLNALRHNRSGFPRLVALKTYNPVVCCAMRSISRIARIDFYPAIDTDGVAGPAASSASAVASTIADGYPFDLTTGVISGIGVPIDLYPSLPTSADRTVNTFFERHTRPGDRVLCLLRFPTDRSVRTVLRFFGGAGTLDEEENRAPLAP